MHHARSVIIIHVCGHSAALDVNVGTTVLVVERIGFK